MFFGTEFCVSTEANENEAVLTGKVDDAMLDQSPLDAAEFRRKRLFLLPRRLFHVENDDFFGDGV